MTTESSSLLAFLRPRAVWVNKHTEGRTEITDFASRIERVPSAAGGFVDDPQLVVHHTANVPPGHKKGWGEDALSFVEHWQPLETTRCGADFTWDGGPSPYKSERERGERLTWHGDCELPVGHDGPHGLRSFDVIEGES